MKEEGVMIGGSAGMAIYGAILYALKHKDTLTEKDKIVVILPDGIRNYMTKFLSTAWMVENKYLPY